MKCSSCGLPLSPSRIATNCPRCGAPTDAASNTAQPQYQQAYWETPGVVDAGAGTPPPNYQWAQNVQSPPSFSPPPGSRNTKPGFILAGLCIFAGGLILLFVYFLATGLPGGNSSNSTTTTSTPNILTSTSTNAPTATANPSQTATIYPGQQYIDNAQMSAAVDSNTLQPTQLTTTFKTGQNIYISFQLHPAGHAGAVCIIWYLNSKQITNFNLPVSATSKYSYAFSIYAGAGAAYVELYWASTTKCTDQVLAQHVDFTVIN
jgi:hypothetical protein